MAKGDIGNALGGPFRVPAPESIPPEAQLINAIIEAGLEAPSEIILMGRIHRGAGTAKGKKQHGILPTRTVSPPVLTATGKLVSWKSGAPISGELSFSERMQRDKRYAGG